MRDLVSALSRLKGCVAASMPWKQVSYPMVSDYNPTDPSPASVRARWKRDELARALLSRAAGSRIFVWAHVHVIASEASEGSVRGGKDQLRGMRLFGYAAATYQGTRSPSDVPSASPAQDNGFARLRCF
ncbi:predicted protein [Pyrenophora tritici-repentis Pt-1C-BFP]|uniref:Uncharacterized protein n=1 Tax=Pyrenophora tritici-repentis (strain Pt-1C-BFP) TaxID=426418 RepID=B2WHK3_PYRTR|nr:uncharacterized protein PTRG_09462 [Pyrenophora tritici-repentis Pt-1C-BFP]EDU42513.1 predicted protein [Pyrenophora tritici-repentis Pt-1C-BFP]